MYTIEQAIAGEASVVASDYDLNDPAQIVLLTVARTVEFAKQYEALGGDSDDAGAVFCLGAIIGTGITVDRELQSVRQELVALKRVVEIQSEAILNLQA